MLLRQGWPQIYTLIKYDGGVRGISGEIINYYCVLQWVFMDILIIAISICLSTRLRQLNEHMKQYDGMVNDSIDLYIQLRYICFKSIHFWCQQKMPAGFWTTQRQHYASISMLIAKVDKKLSIVTVFSVSSNLYQILIKLLHSFE